ncbi:MAG: hypothetical protein LBT30_00980 [Clostridiales bacterium]|jgi:hypothetical protein|nr:hypothetical protein [Clostridiales bacterium]
MKRKYLGLFLVLSLIIVAVLLSSNTEKNLNVAASGGLATQVYYTTTANPTLVLMTNSSSSRVKHEFTRTKVETVNIEQNLKHQFRFRNDTDILQEMEISVTNTVGSQVTGTISASGDMIKLESGLTSTTLKSETRTVKITVKERTTVDVYTYDLLYRIHYFSDKQTSQQKILFLYINLSSKTVYSSINEYSLSQGYATVQS